MAALVLASMVVTGCVAFEPVEYECASDRDCNGVCSDVGICIERGTAQAARVTWIGPGEDPAAACAEIDEIEVRFSGEGTESSFGMVPCLRGTLEFERIPPYYDHIVLHGYSRAGAELLRTRVELSNEPTRAAVVKLAP